MAMASAALAALPSTASLHHFGAPASVPSPSLPLRSQVLPLRSNSRRINSRVVCALGDVSAESTAFLVAGAVGIGLIGTAFPILFSRKDICPECDGAGFVRKSTSVLTANAARKDQAQIVCSRCNSLGKLGQVDK